MKRLLPRSICIVLAMVMVIAMSAFARGNSLKAGSEADGYESDGTETVTTTISADEVPDTIVEAAESAETVEALGADGDADSHTVTIIYMYEDDSSEAAPSESYDFYEGESVKIMFPQIDGYKSVLAAVAEPCDGVSFVMGKSDIEIVVYYVAEDTGDAPEKKDPTVSEDKIKIVEKTGSGSKKKSDNDKGTGEESGSGSEGGQASGTPASGSGDAAGTSGAQGGIETGSSEGTSDASGNAEGSNGAAVGGRDENGGSATGTDNAEASGELDQTDKGEADNDNSAAIDDSDKKIVEIKINDDGTYELAVIADDDTPLAGVEGTSRTHIWMYIVLAAMIAMLGAYGILKFRDKKQS